MRGNLSSRADDGASSARQEPDSPATKDAGRGNAGNTGFDAKARYRRALDARAGQMRDARLAAALDRLRQALKPKAPTARPRVVAALSPFLWLGGRVVFQLSAIMKRRQRKRRAKEKQRRQGGRAVQIRKGDIRAAKQDAQAARFASLFRVDRKPIIPARSPPRSPKRPPPRPHPK